MCGIAGIVEKREGRSPDPERLRRMSVALGHRGPDDEGIQVEGPVGLVHRRLTIIDLVGGRQPMADASGQVRIVFNGEIYNFRELGEELALLGRAVSGRSDTEVLLAAYLEWGTACPERLNGMFAFVIHDGRTGTIFAARDRFGEKPLYLCETASELCFASELKALVKGGAELGPLDPRAIYQYFTRGYVSGPGTIFAGARRLQPAHAFAWSREGSRTWRYWTPPEPTAGITDPDEAIRRTEELLRDSVRMRLVSDVPLGFFLSGGIDSSLVVSLGAEVAPGRMETFAIGFEEPRYDERPYAREVAERFGTRHHEFVLRPEGVEVAEELAWHLDEPFADSSALPTYFLSRLTREHVKVALSGDGGDEMFAGYDVYRGHVLSERVRRLPTPVLRAGAEVLERTGRLGGERRERLERAARNLRDAGRESPLRFRDKQQMIFRSSALAGFTEGAWVAGETGRESGDFRRRFAAFASPLEAMAAWQRENSLVDDMLVKVDRMSMASSLEVRTPFLDHRVAELVNRIPFSVKMPELRTKHLLKRILARHLSEEFVSRPKQGFVVPLNAWFRDDLVGYARGLVLAPEGRSRTVLRREALERILGEHAAGRRNWGPAVWALVMFENWCRRFGVEADAVAGAVRPDRGNGESDAG